MIVGDSVRNRSALSESSPSHSAATVSGSGNAISVMKSNGSLAVG